MDYTVVDELVSKIRAAERTCEHHMRLHVVEVERREREAQDFEVSHWTEDYDHARKALAELAAVLAPSEELVIAKTAPVLAEVHLEHPDEVIDVCLPTHTMEQDLILLHELIAAEVPADVRFNVMSNPFGWSAPAVTVTPPMDFPYDHQLDGSIFFACSAARTTRACDVLSTLSNRRLRVLYIPPVELPPGGDERYAELRTSNLPASAALDGAVRMLNPPSG